MSNARFCWFCSHALAAEGYFGRKVLGAPDSALKYSEVIIDKETETKVRVHLQCVKPAMRDIDVRYRTAQPADKRGDHRRVK